MTSIEYVSLEGIRAFSPHPDAQQRPKQQLKFLKPLTIILGANGAGKTTIIEALRNACTGELPPGTGSGSSFIHDPRMANDTEVKAQIRLQFHSASRNAKVLVVRSFQVTQKKSQQTFKRVDATVQLLKEDGTSVSLGHRCAEIDKVVPEFMGVPKPILDGVIFCHQEDGNWPLGDPKTLKTRFDDIFAATRYTKALEEVRRCRKEKLKEVQELDKASAVMGEQKAQADKLQAELKDLQAKMATIQGQLGDLQAKGEVHRAQLAKVQEAEAAIQALQDCIRTQEARNESDERHCQMLAVDDRSFPEDDATLRRMEAEFDAVMQRLGRQVQDERAQVQEQEAVVGRLTDQLLGVRGRREVLEGEKQLYEAKLQDIQAVVHRACQQFQISLDVGGAASASFVSGDGVLRFLQHFEAAIRQLEKEQQQLKAEHRAALAKEEEKLGRQRQKIKELTDEAKRKEAEIQRLGVAMSDDEREITRLGTAEQALRKTEEEVTTLERELETRRKDTGLDRVKVGLAAKREEVARINARLTEVQAELEQRKTEQQHTMALRTYRQEVSVKKETMEGRHRQYESRFLQLFQGRAVKLPFLSDRVREAGRLREEQLAAEQQRVQRVTAELAAAQAEQAQGQRQRTALERELAGKQREIQEQESALPLADVVKVAQSEADKLQNKLTTTRALLHCYTEFIRQAQERHVCPTCSRGLTDAEVSRFVRDQQAKCDKAPGLIRDTEAALSAKRSLVERLQGLVKVEEQALVLQGQVEQLKRQLQEVEARVDVKQAELKAVQAARDKARAEEQEARALALEADVLKRMHDELQDLEATVQKEEKKLQKPSRFGRTFEEAQKEASDLQVQREAKAQEMDELRASAEAEAAQLQAAERTLGDRQREVYRLRLELGQRQERLQQLRGRQEEAERLRREVAQGQQAVPPAQADLQRMEAAREQLMKAQDAREQQLADRLSARAAEFQKVSIHAREIRRYAEEGKAAALEAARAEEEEVALQVERRRQEARQRSRALAEASEQHQQQSGRKGQLQRVLQYRASKARLLASQAAVERMHNELRDKTAHLWVEGPGSGPGKNCRQYREEQRAKLQELETSAAYLDGERNQLRDRVAVLERELRSQTYDRIADRYKSVIIKLKTLDMACKDLEKYAGALDKALMKYHSGKMAEINALVRDLWQRTYRGQDIDYIEIRSDEETAGEAVRTRNYNYRVVMVKGKVALDMRGRCSAGQKVLASLVIRLALSEAFCCDCGVLALDEPTTNLDQDNIHSLAEALQALIHSRQGQRGFQLVVITHDEDFVRALGSSGVAEHFYYVSKDIEGQCSTIVRKNLTDL